MKYSLEAYKNAPVDPGLTPQEKKTVQRLEKLHALLVERLRKYAFGPQNTLRAELSFLGLIHLSNRVTKLHSAAVPALIKIGRTKSGLLDKAHDEAWEMNGRNK